MNIKYDEKTKSFYLNTKNTSYVFFINEAGRAEHLYYGESVDCCDLRYMAVRRSYSFAPYDKDYGEELSPDSVFCEIPCENSGDFRPCALGISGKSVDFKYVSHRIYDGAEKIKGLPCSDGDGAESLEIIFSDKIEGVSLRFTYAVYFDCDIISRRAEIINNSRGELRINKAAYSLDLYGRDYDLLELYGTYYRERAEVQRTPLKFGFQGSFSHKGASGHESNPFIAVCENIADEQKNFTHFLLIKKVRRYLPARSKLIYFAATCPHEPGALLKMLQILAVYDLNMTKIESRPIKNSPGEYNFFIEFSGDVANKNVQAALARLAEYSKNFKLLGCY